MSPYVESRFGIAWKLPSSLVIFDSLCAPSPLVREAGIRLGLGMSARLARLELLRLSLREHVDSAAGHQLRPGNGATQAGQGIGD